MQINYNSIYFSILTPDYTVIKYEISGLSLKSTILYKTIYHRNYRNIASPGM